MNHRHHHSGVGRHAASLNIPLILQRQWRSQTNGGIHRPPTISGNISLLSCHRIPPAGFNVRSMANKSFSVNDQKTEKNFHFMFSLETWLNKQDCCSNADHFYQSVRPKRKRGGFAAILSTQYVWRDTWMSFCHFNIFLLSSLYTVSATKMFISVYAETLWAELMTLNMID